MASRKAKNIILKRPESGINDALISGRSILIPESIEQQTQGFYHKDAAFLIRNYTGIYKEMKPKGAK